MILREISPTLQLILLECRVNTQHSDFEVFSKHLSVTSDSIRPYSSSRNETVNGIDYTVVTEFNYVRCGKKYWNKSDVNDLKAKFEEINKNTTDFDFELHSTSDWELDDDRYQEASISFKTVLKS
ncbi:MAG: hypothetical protein H0X63_00085 [Flavobacteriales bacterium]|nr:hypothetical protein [Flavobacteriales bacterium]